MLLGLGGAKAATVPSGFVDEVYSAGFSNPMGIVFDDLGRGYSWDKAGQVFLHQNNTRTVILDIREEVGNWRDFGLMSVALDPQFLTNGRIYLSYLVDRHHLFTYGTNTYNANTNWYYSASIHRVTRYAATFSGSSVTIPRSSRKVLLGQTHRNGIPLTHESHGCGTIVFGEDGTLLLATGDNASYNTADKGSAPETFYAQALANGIIRPAENVGAWRSQLVNSLAGKILRINPEDGLGYASNPFYDPSNPDAPRSKVWALGLRNPARMSIMPNTGSVDPAAGRPGVLHIVDVGWGAWEDFEVCFEPGQNFGWPAFEGLDFIHNFYDFAPENLDAPKPGGGFYRFRDLIAQDQEDRHAVIFPGVPNSIPTFVHDRAAISWKHYTSNARTGIYDTAGNAATIRLDQAGSPIPGPNFSGNCATGSAPHNGVSYPASYGASHFIADYGEGWIRRLKMDASGYPISAHNFASNAGRVIWLKQDPNDGSLLYARIDTGEIRRIRYNGNANIAPNALAELSEYFSANDSLEVSFFGDLSNDPEQGTQGLSYAWDFGDGGTSNQVNPQHTFTTTVTTPVKFEVTLTVTDAQGASGSATYRVHLNNTPACLEVITPTDGDYYSVNASENYQLKAIFHDLETTQAEHDFLWSPALFHSNHLHPEAVDSSFTSSLQASPTPDDGEFYAYRALFEAKDSHGLTGSRAVWLYPRPKAGRGLNLTQPVSGTVVETGTPVTVTAESPNPASAISKVKFFADGKMIGVAFAAPYTITWTPTGGEDYSLSAMAIDAASGESYSSRGRRLFVREEGDLVEAKALSIYQHNSRHWNTVKFDQPFVFPPAVVLGSFSYNGGHPSTSRVRNITCDGFEYQLDEWDYLDGGHAPERLAFLAVEKGRHNLAGLEVIAGSGKADHITSWYRFAGGAMSSTPVVLAQITSYIGWQAATPRITNVRAQGFSLHFDEEEANDGGHALEDISYIALQKGSSAYGIMNVQTHTQGGYWKTVTPPAAMGGTGTPLVFSAMQTENGGDPALMRYRDTPGNADPRFIDLLVEEERSRDVEVIHVPEQVGIVLIPQ